ncbi:hypothetical protein EBX31_11020 [bacterium]|nr:hypothetical protein [bacterium]
MLPFSRFIFSSRSSSIGNKQGIPFLAALGLNGVLLVSFANFTSPTLWEHRTIAENIYSGKGFDGGLFKANGPTSWRAPGHPYLLAGLWGLREKFPWAYVLLGLVQSAALASMVCPIHFFSCRGILPGTLT